MILKRLATMDVAFHKLIIIVTPLSYACSTTPEKRYKIT
jgi:hypothetical protein